MVDINAMRLDQSVSRPEQDRYGFRYVSAQLAQSVQAIGRRIGIEGAWGSGKSWNIPERRPAIWHHWLRPRR